MRKVGSWWFWILDQIQELDWEYLGAETVQKNGENFAKFIPVPPIASQMLQEP